jgi:uroporphyrinogen III methyltransferase/synthase
LEKERCFVTKVSVFLIGAGPGDPGLMTLKGVEALKKADVIIYDHLVNEAILAHREKDARLIYAGKEGGNHSLSQEQINECLAAEAEKGLTVARLKGGDPFIFGRGGEEVEFLARRNISFEIIPGVSSAIAAPAYAGIPLTHRAYASSVAFITGHEDPTKDKSHIHWKSLAEIETLVFLMGVKNLPHITASLMAAGKSPSTPAALIHWGTTPRQKTLTGSLDTLVRLAEEQGLTPPAVLVVGHVVSLRPLLNWFEKKPLLGKGVVITRPEGQTEEFQTLLQGEGAQTYLFPTIRIIPPETFRPLDQAIKNMEKYDWLIFTSTNAVRFFFQRIKETSCDIRNLKGIKICTIGPATARSLETYGLAADLVPEKFSSEGIIAAFRSEDIRGKNILIPRAEKTRDILPRELTACGANVDCVTAYRTVASGGKKEEFINWINEGRIHVITFTSPSTVEHFIAMMGNNISLLQKIKIACIGPVTAEAAREAGLVVDILQEQYVVPAMVQSMSEHFATLPPI